METYRGRNSVTIERFGGRVTAPIKRTTLGCLTLFMISTLEENQNINSSMSMHTLTYSWATTTASVGILNSNGRHNDFKFHYLNTNVI